MIMMMMIYDGMGFNLVKMFGYVVNLTLFDFKFDLVLHWFCSHGVFDRSSDVDS